MIENPQKKAEIRTNVPAAAGGEPESWNGNEMEGMGNAGYSFVDSDTSVAGNGGAAIPGTFGFLNGGAGPGDRQGNSAASSRANKTKKEQMFDEQLDLYKQNRDVGIRQQPTMQ
jgi:hypothetical protein